MRSIGLKVSAFYLLLVSGITPVFAANLISVYERAAKYDPAFKAAEATWLSGKENIPIARSSLLPQLTLNGSYARVHTDQYSPGGFGGSKTWYSSNGAYSVSLSQAIFNYQAWKQLSSAKATTKQAAAVFSQAAQDLLFNTSSAYFEALKADAVLQADVAERESLHRQLKQTQARYDVGVDDVTALDEARSRYEGSLAKEITDRQALAKRIEDIRAITGLRYDVLYGVGNKLPPMIKPASSSIDSWVATTIRQNFNIQAAKFAKDAAEQNISVASAARFPVVDFVPSYSFSRTGKTIQKKEAETYTASVGVSVNFPVFQGGGVFAQTKQANYNYQAASDNLDKALRDEVKTTRQAFLDIIAISSRIKADKSRIVAAQSAVNSTQAAYDAGVRTLVDVLDRMTELYNAKRDYAKDRYDLLISSLQLKKSSGTLKAKDLKNVNAWLKERHNVHESVLGYKHTEELLSSGPNKRASKVAHKRSSSIKKSSKLHRKLASKNLKAAHKRTSATKSKPSIKVKAKKHLAKGPYSIQVAAEPNYKDAVKFINNKHIKGEAWMKKMYGGAFYRVYYKHYPSYKDASNDLKKIPRSLIRLKPYVVKVSG